MTPGQVRACFDEVWGHAAGHSVRPLVEAFEVTTVAKCAATGMGCISSGVLTNTVPALDLGLDLLQAEISCC